MVKKMAITGKPHSDQKMLFIRVYRKLKNLMDSKQKQALTQLMFREANVPADVI